MPPEDLVRLLDNIFTAFDELALTYGLEKIKTIGDAHMVASGLPQPRPSHIDALAQMALAMQRVMRRSPALELRMGLDVGPVVAGVIGEEQVHLRPLGGSREHGQPDGVARHPGIDPGDGARVRASRGSVRVPGSGDDRGQREGSAADVPPYR